jgi:hypothetical protein
MAYNRINPLTDIFISAFSPVAGTPTGMRISAPSPVKGRLLEAGFMPASLVASAITLAVAVSDNTVSTTASNFTQCVTSTLGTFASTNLFEGACASVVPPSPTYLNAGDAIQWTASGGNTSAIGATFYAIVRKGG